jgi:hypothetical protein
MKDFEKPNTQKSLEFLLEAVKTGKKFRRCIWDKKCYYYFKDGVLFDEDNKNVNFNFQNSDTIEWYTEPKKIVRYDAVKSETENEFDCICFDYENRQSLKSFNLSEIKQDAKGLYIEREE